MDRTGLDEILTTMRRLGGEPTEIEAKSGAGGYPKSLVDTMVSFANTDGGLIVIGVDEADDFTVTGVEQAAAYRDCALGQAADAVEPPIQVDVEFVDYDGRQVVMIDVPSASPHEKPVHLKTKGPSTGALIRSGDGDRRMTPTEIGLLYASRTQPVDDKAPVTTALVSDLSKSAIARTLDRIRAGAPSLRTLDDDEAMRRLNITVRTASGTVVPTLAGLLVFGDYPQQHFPQLMVSVIVVGTPVDGQRFVDNVTVRGSIPAMVSETIAALRKNLTARTVVTGEGRIEHLDYSLEAIREAVVNALLHRDYSELTRGTQVQIELHPDRLTVSSPGGLYGPISGEELGDAGVSSSRNAVLASLLSDAYLPGTDRLVAENRASGIPTMIREAQRLGQTRPVFSSTVTRFLVKLSSSELLGEDTRAWLDSIGGPWPSTMHEIALAMMRADHATNEMLREWGADRITAGAVLRDLVTAGVAVKSGGRRFASYTLSPSTPRSRPETARDAMDDNSSDALILRAIAGRGQATSLEVSQITGLGRSNVINRLNEMITDGRVVGFGAPRSPRRAYRIGPATAR